MIKICLFGATDRFNYGDLLFPLILNHEIVRRDKNKMVVIENYGIISSDLSDKGAMPSKSIAELYYDIRTAKSRLFLIVVGGEIVGVQWGSTLSCLNARYKKFYDFNRFFLKRYAYIFNDPVAKIILGGKSKYPFLLSRKKFPNITGTISNAVGGIRNLKFTPNKQIVVDILENSNYCSFRDIGIYDEMSSYIPKAKLSPDSAIVMSTIYSKEFLKVKYMAGSLPFENYVFFQISKREAKEFGYDYILRKLKNLIALDKNIVLCPIGTALGHEDHIPLIKLYKSLNENEKKNIFYAQEPTILDIMSLIAHAELYIGSSLHGVITAMSYSLPYLAIRENEKISYYLKSWAVQGLQNVTKKDNWDNNIGIALNIENKMLKNSSTEQIDLALNSFNEFMKIIIP